MPTKGDFSLSVSEFVRKTGLRADLVLRKITLAIYDGVIRMTPVDTARARSGWQLGVNRVKLDALPEGLPSYPGADMKMAEAVAASGPVRFGDTLWITNNVPYIGHLDDGSSTQAPTGMVGPTLTRVTAEFNATVEAAKRQLP